MAAGFLSTRASMARSHPTHANFQGLLVKLQEYPPQETPRQPFAQTSIAHATLRLRRGWTTPNCGAALLAKLELPAELRVRCALICSPSFRCLRSHPRRRRRLTSLSDPSLAGREKRARRGDLPPLEHTGRKTRKTARTYRKSRTRPLRVLPWSRGQAVLVESQRGEIHI